MESSKGQKGSKGQMGSYRKGTPSRGCTTMVFWRTEKSLVQLEHY